MEENENYLIKIHDPEKLKYDITYQFNEYSVVSLPLDTPSNLNFQEIEMKLAESGKFFSIFNLLNNICRLGVSPSLVSRWREVYSLLGT